MTSCNVKTLSLKRRWSFALPALMSSVLLVTLLGVDGCGNSSPSGPSDTPADPAGDAPATGDPSDDGAGTIKPDPDGPRNDLDAMDTADLTINGNPFHVWLADEPRKREVGLMNVEQHELARRDDGADRGMLFIFPFEQPLSFWMRNTIIPLDIAYIRTDGTIVKTYTMAPLETRTYPSIEPARYALEVRAGLFDELGIRQGDTVEIPDSVLKRSGR